MHRVYLASSLILTLFIAIKTYKNDDGRTSHRRLLKASCIFFGGGQIFFFFPSKKELKVKEQQGFDLLVHFNNKNEQHRSSLPSL